MTTNGTAAAPNAKKAIDGLKAHQRHAELIGTADDDVIRDRAADIKTNGLHRPIEILPGGTVVAGYQDWLACKLLGCAEVPVAVNRALAKQDATAVERRVIEDLLNSRFDSLLRARCYFRLLELDKGRQFEKLFRWEQQDLLDRVMSRFFASQGRRNQDRYKQLLLGPIDVFNAFRAGDMSLLQACAICGLPSDQQEQIVAPLREGGNAKAIVAKYIAKQPKQKPADSLFARFINKIGSTITVLDADMVPKITRMTPKDISILSAGMTLLQSLLKRAKTIKRAEKHAPKNVAQALRELDDLEEMAAEKET